MSFRWCDQVALDQFEVRVDYALDFPDSPHKEVLVLFNLAWCDSAKEADFLEDYFLWVGGIWVEEVLIDPFIFVKIEQIDEIVEFFPWSLVHIIKTSTT